MVEKPSHNESPTLKGDSNNKARIQMTQSPKTRQGRNSGRTVRSLCTALALVLVVTLAAGVSIAVFWLHIGIRPVLSGSMRPTYGPGWAIITRPLPVNQVRRGDIVVFTPPGEAAQFAHRVTSVSGPHSHPVITTKGDANPMPDPWHARLEASTVPQVVGEVPWLGYAIVGIKDNFARVLLIALVGLGVCWMGTRAILGRSPSGAAVSAMRPAQR